MPVSPARAPRAPDREVEFRPRPQVEHQVNVAVRVLGMPGPTAGSTARVGRARTLAQVYRHFGDVGGADTSPLYARIAAALSESDEALHAIAAAPARRRDPKVILAALHDLVLAGRAPTPAAAYADGDADAAAGAALDTLLGMTDSVLAIAARRRTRTREAGRCAVLYPAIVEAARRVRANAVGLIDVGCAAGLNLNVDRVGITYSNGQVLGDPSSPVQLSSSIVGGRPIPTRRGWPIPKGCKTTASTQGRAGSIRGMASSRLPPRLRADRAC